MNESNGYAVFFFPPALEALGEAIKPYLQENAAGVHVLCQEIDTGGTLIEMTVRGRTPEGRDVESQLMVPSNMVRIVVSTHSDGLFGFGPQIVEKPAAVVPQASPTVFSVIAPPATAAAEPTQP